MSGTGSGAGYAGDFRGIEQRRDQQLAGGIADLEHDAAMLATQMRDACDF
ncbi:hypothetical protein [Acidovorax sp.]